MKNHSDAQEGADPSQRKKVVTISERKLKANRENAKKSTGPRTTRGKDFSRRNAAKHGLFASPVGVFEALDEDPNEYAQLLQDLWDHHQPVGRAEEIEVERIAVCCWRLKRAWRYENAVNVGRDIDKRALDEQMTDGIEKDKKDTALIAQLSEAEKEIEERGKISEALKQKILASPELERAWSAHEEYAERRIKEPEVAKIAEQVNPERWLTIRQIVVTKELITLLEKRIRVRWACYREALAGRDAIPNSEDLDRLLRYETTIERQRGRAIDHLERLQRRRLGEFVPPSVRVQLT